MVKHQLRNANNEGLGYNLADFMQASVFRSTFHDAVAPVLMAEAAIAAEATHECVIACFDALVGHLEERVVWFSKSDVLVVGWWVYNNNQ